MSENLDSDLELEGTPEQPNSGGSQEKGDSLNSNAAQSKVDAESITRDLAEVKKQLRSLQGDKDRGVAQTRRDVDDLKRKLAEIEKLKKRGLSEDDAFEEFELREQLRSLRLQPKSAGNAEGETVDKAETLRKYGLDENDPDVASAFSGVNFGSTLEMENAALKVALKKANKPKPDPAAAPSATGSTPVTMRDEEAASKLRQLENYYREPSKYGANIKTIETELRSAGYL